MDVLVEALRGSNPGQERKDLYRHYLSSSDWSNLRKAVIARDKSCRLCASAKSLNVHHRTYARVGDEDLDDLTLLCRRCHERHHDSAWVPAAKPKRPRKKKPKKKAPRPKQAKKPRTKKPPARSVVLVSELLQTSEREWTNEQLFRALAAQGITHAQVNAAVGALNLRAEIIRSPHRIARWRWANPSLS